MAKADDPIILALDIGERRRLLELAGRLRGEVRTVKIGLEAYTWCGPDVLREMSSLGYRVFADLKLHDIPNTVVKAALALVEAGAEMLTVHVSGGRRMLERVVESVRERRKALGREVAVLGVTVLTSLDEASWLELGFAGKTEDAVVAMAKLGWECGLDGFVCSPREVAALRRALGEEPLIVTPGIRLPGMEVHDQARTATPWEALEAGADYLVVGRAVTAEEDPIAALRRVRARMEG